MRCLVLLLFLLPQLVPGQIGKKEIAAVKTDMKLQIDGDLSDPAWAYAPVATDFRMFQPGNGEPIPQAFRTEVRVLYSDEAIYFGIFMRDPHPDSIRTQLTERNTYDEHTDWVQVSINPFNDGLNDFNFIVTAAGTITDSRNTPNGEDRSLNSIWHSATRITEEGWLCEIEVPYISLRFPQNVKKDWGLNVIRSIRRSREQYSWNFINRELGYSNQYQAGLLTGVEDINAPIRLSFMPYSSAYVSDYNGQREYEFNAGLDLKYGIDQSFTLDMTLIPDFGQVAFDNQFLNLTPFENRFEENRQFFSEGTDLFTIGDIFYSRRIGGTPKNITNQNLDPDSVDVRTAFTRLLNAAKISGRTKGNLGIGMLNAITDNNYSTTIDPATGEVIGRNLLEPLTNYNVLVLDQRFNRNSSVSLVNTNTLRNGNAPDANVAALVASVFTPSGQYRSDASYKRSDRFFDDSISSGYEASLRFGNVDGHWRWATLQTVQSDSYDINDLGFQARNNQIRNYSEVEYLTFKPKGVFNRTSYTLYNIYSSIYRPQRYEEWAVGLNTFFLLRDFTGTGIRLRTNPVERVDYFEPRTPGGQFRRPPRWSAEYFISTDYRKPLALDMDFRYEHVPDFQSDGYRLNLEPRIRLGDHFFVIPQLTYDYTFNDHGWAGAPQGKAVMGRRHVRNVTANIDGRYVFNPRSTLGLRLYQFWSRIGYRELFDLTEGGRLQPNGLPNEYDSNFSLLNLDLRFSWWFAPASKMVILYRATLNQAGRQVITDYRQNIDRMLMQPVRNNLSIRIAYMLDYNQARQWIKRR